ncbi:MAG: TIGR00725 family protein [Deltaproteobacteria bacterium]|nr:MAG: TIGR00725 family protein [Deltaproteobacteria bacterium]
MNHQPIIGVMGGGRVSDAHLETARILGKKIAEHGWILLNGGRNAGIMAASAKGAYEAGGLTIGILPDTTADLTSPHIRIPVLTGMGQARNVINVLSSHVIVACAGGPGTVSEVVMALKAGRSVILLAPSAALSTALQELRPQTAPIFTEPSVEGVISRIQTLLGTPAAPLRALPANGHPMT